MKVVFSTIFVLLLISFIGAAVAENNDKVAVLETEHGKLVIEFFPDDAPNTVENFIKLVEAGFYDSTIFHRVISDFMIQGGDPLTKPGAYQSAQKEWGTGGPVDEDGNQIYIPAEFNTIKHNRGILSMARSAHPDSAGSQFFIVHGDAPWLDEQYTAFGRLITEESFQTLDSIASLKTVGPPTDTPLDWASTEIIYSEILLKSKVTDYLELGEPERTRDSLEIPSNEYRNLNYDFSFMIPDGWIAQEPYGTDPNTPIVVVTALQKDNVTPQIYFQIVNLGIMDKGVIRYESFDDESQKMIEDFQKKSEESDTFTLLNSKKISVGEDLHIYGLEALQTIQGDDSSQIMKFRQLLIPSQQKIYLITYSNLEKNFNLELDQLEQIVSSFRVLSEQTPYQENEKETMLNMEKIGEISEKTTDSESPENGGGCLIATATFGSELAPQVQQLRELRDNSLMTTSSGSVFLTGFNSLYYSFSPVIADYERENPVFKETVKLTITPLLTSLSLLNYVDIDSEASVLGYGIGIILMNISMYFVVPAVLIWQIKKRI